MATLDEIQKSLEDNRDKVHKKDYAFFRVDYIATLAKASVREGCDCRECCANTEKLALFAATYADLINSGEAGKRQLEDCMDEVTNHLVKQHGYARTGWYKAMYSFIGFGAGLVLAFMAVLLLRQGVENIKSVFLVVLFLGIAAGYIVGVRKDANYRRNHKNL